MSFLYEIAGDYPARPVSTIIEMPFGWEIAGDHPFLRGGRLG
ncbi:hypothetical protein NXS08_03670 [Gleimia sp. 6138-11-ORH1]|nr:hypothetical protein [Gleimia sp. 6138-11-ORH1]MCS4484586.1 hypothetical protein [Gleimia sp. 6138-11-ORH1]